MFLAQQKLKQFLFFPRKKTAQETISNMNIKYTTPKLIILILMKTKEKRKSLKAIMIEGTLFSKEQKI